MYSKPFNNKHTNINTVQDHPHNESLTFWNATSLTEITVSITLRFYSWFDFIVHRPVHPTKAFFKSWLKLKCLQCNIQSGKILGLYSTQIYVVVCASRKTVAFISKMAQIATVIQWQTSKNIKIDLRSLVLQSALQSNALSQTLATLAAAFSFHGWPHCVSCSVYNL